ncbi:MAG: SRPBCC domain-containing protein [Chloroflexota bacterium]
MAFQFFDGERGTIKKGEGHTVLIHTEVIINAHPDKVWAVLTDWGKLPEWSPGLLNLTGDFCKDGNITATFKLGIGEHAQDFTHPLIYFEEGRMFGWSAPLPYMAGMTDHHIYKLEPLPEGRTRFLQTDQLTGGLEHVIGAHMARGMMQSYVEFNRALKVRVEGMA